MASASAMVSACSSRATVGEPSVAAATTLARSPGRPGRGGWRCPAAAGGGGPGRRASRGRRPAKADARGRVARPSTAPGARCGRRASPCRCRAAARRSAAGRGGRPRGCSAAASDGGLDQVPVDGEAVHRVALRAAAHPLPVREQPDEQARPGPAPPTPATAARRRRAGSTNASRASAGQGVGQRRATRRPAGRTRAGTAAGRPGPRRPAARSDQHRVAARVGVAGQHDLAVLLDHAVGQRARGCGPGRPAAAEHRRQRRPSAGAQHAVDRAPGDVGGVGDGAGGLDDLAQQRVGVEQAEGVRRPGPAPAATSRSVARPVTEVQRVADVEQRRRGRPRGPRGARRRPRTRRRRAATVTSRSPPRASLRSGSSRKASSPGRARRARSAELAQLGRAAWAPAAPVGEDAARSAAASAGSPATCRASSRPSSDLEVVARRPGGPRRRAHRVVEARRRCPRPGTRCGRRAPPPRRRACPSCSSTRSRSLPGESSPRP